MTSIHPSSTVPATSIHPETNVNSVVALTVADLARSVWFYTEAIGLAVIARHDGVAMLGVAGHPLLQLIEVPGAQPWIESATGLYHVAILLPTRADLGRWIYHWNDLGMPEFGQGDHLVSEALYLRDPDGHGIEIYRDRPRSDWQWDGDKVRMASLPVDVQGLLREAAASGVSWAGAPEGTTMGHVHLQVGDIPQARAFYSWRDWLRCCGRHAVGALRLRRRLSPSPGDECLAQLPEWPGRTRDRGVAVLHNRVSE